MTSMNTNRSLLERAAEVYDFASGLKVDALPADLPPPRVRRPEPLRPVAPTQPAPQPFPEPQPVSEAPVPAPATARPAAPPPRPVAHAHVEMAREAMLQAGYLLPEAPQSGLAEEMRLIKRRLLAAIDDAEQRGDPQARLVLVTSGQPGEGKTWTALNLALSIVGEQDRTVLLVDGDSAKADLPSVLGIEAGPGLVDALADARRDAEAMILDTDIPGLSFLPAGTKARNVPELLASARTAAVFERLATADPRRIILIDSPPALAASSASVLAGQAGHCLLVVRADETVEADLKETVELLSGCRRLSLVLNNTAFAIGGRRFGRYEEHP